MGALYQAHDSRLGSRCAVKEMLEKFDGADAMVRRFSEEARSLAALNHVGIPHVRDFFKVGSACYVVMDLVIGSNLEEELAERMALVGGPFPPELVVSDAIQILDVLIYLHRLSPPMIHRDIKPANIIREHPSEQIKLVDFGLARGLASSGPTQTIVGTLSYAPIEQLQGRAKPRSDLYALGATMFHLLTGREPGFLEVPKFADVAPATDPALAAIIEKAVATKLDERPQDAREMRQALVDWQDRGKPKSVEGAPTRQMERPVVVAAPETRVIASPPTPLPSRKPWALAGVILSAVLLSGWWFHQKPAPRPISSPTVVEVPTPKPKPKLTLTPTPTPTVVPKPTIKPATKPRPPVKRERAAEPVYRAPVHRYVTSPAPVRYVHHASPAPPRPTSGIRPSSRPEEH